MTAVILFLFLWAIVPELASRAHQENIVPVVSTALSEAGIQLEDVDAIAFTQAPGLIGSLLVGAQFAKSLMAPAKPKPALKRAFENRRKLLDLSWKRGLSRSSYLRHIIRAIVLRAVTQT